MTLKFMDGFETYNDAVDFGKVYTASSYSYSNDLTFPTEGRNGGKCLRWDGNGNGNIYSPINGNMFASQEYAILGFAFYVIVIDNIQTLTFYFDNGGQGGMTIDFLD